VRFVAAVRYSFGSMTTNIRTTCQKWHYAAEQLCTCLGNTADCAVNIHTTGKADEAKMNVDIVHLYLHCLVFDVVMCSCKVYS